MEALKEVTVWNTEFQANHTYLLDKDKVIAYIKFHKGEPIWGTPMKFDKRYRKFEKAPLALFESSPNWKNLLKGFVETAPALPFIKKVQGSKPNTWYEVNTDEKTCTCPGFTFRGTCKHVNEIETVA
jgi:hypothetical protein